VDSGLLRRASDRTAPVYDERFRALQEEKYRIVLGRLGALPTGRLLDLGCGTGLLSPHLPRPAVGLDLSAAMLRRAHPRGVLAVQGDADALPFADASFAAVLSFTSLVARVSAGPALTEVARVLRPGGLLLLTLLPADLPADLTTVADAGGLVREDHFACGQDVGFRFRRAP